MLVIPGPAVTYIVSRSIAHGRAAGLVSVLGITTGTFCHILAATLGLSALLVSSAAAFQSIKYVGAAYLIYLGIKTLRQKDEHLGEAGTSMDRALSSVYSIPRRRSSFWHFCRSLWTPRADASRCKSCNWGFCLRGWPGSATRCMP